MKNNNFTVKGEILYCSGYYAGQYYDVAKLTEKFVNKEDITKKIDDVIYISRLYDEQKIEIFYFPFGAIVIWGANQEQRKEILTYSSQFTKKKPNNTLKEDTEYENEAIKCIYAKTYPSPIINEENDVIIINENTIFTKLAISYALAQSVNLSFLENSVEKLLRNTQPIHQELAQKGIISLSKKEISKKIGALFQQKYAVNMHSEVLDIPEIFWKMPSYEPLYIMAAKIQDIQARQSVLNKKLQLLEDLYSLLTSELNQKHSTKLEIIIIILITIEIILGLLNLR